MDNNAIKYPKNGAVSTAVSAHTGCVHCVSRRIKAAGFTLIEMLVVLAIISVIIGIVVVSQHSFDNSMILSNTAYDIALSVREAQAYGNAGHGKGSGGTLFPVSYGTGIDFNVSTPHRYILFADTYPSSSLCYSTTGTGPSTSPAQRTGDCKYTSGVGKDTLIKKYSINNDFTISGLFIQGVTAQVTRLDIVYAREEVMGNIYYRSGNSWSKLSNGSSAHIEIASPDKTSHECITVTTINVISVKHGSC